LFLIAVWTHCAANARANGKSDGAAAASSILAGGRAHSPGLLAISATFTNSRVV
jgi:hypothetical protein